MSNKEEPNPKYNTTDSSKDWSLQKPAQEAKPTNGKPVEDYKLPQHLKDFMNEKMPPKKGK